MPDIAVPLRSFYVVVTVPLDADRGELVPLVWRPPATIEIWTPEAVMFSTTVKAATMLQTGTTGWRYSAAGGDPRGRRQR
jgi:hypothetical protein